MKLKIWLVAGAIALAAGGASAKNYVVDLEAASVSSKHSQSFNIAINAGGAFENSFSFTPVEKSWSKGTLITGSNSSHDLIKFLGATLNGKEFSFGTAVKGNFGFPIADFFSGPLLHKIWEIALPFFKHGTKIPDFCVETGPVSPVPEPETYAMMLAGLGFIGVIARRRNKRNSDSATVIA